MEEQWDAMPEAVEQAETVEQPSQPNAYEAIIAQQQEQINALIAQTQAQSEQITRLVQTGGQIHQQPAPVQQPAQPPRGQAPVSQPLHAQYPNYYEPSASMGKFNPAPLADDRDWSLEGLAGKIGKK